MPLLVEADFGPNVVPHFLVVTDPTSLIPCTGVGDVAATYGRLILQLTNDGNGNSAQTAHVILGRSVSQLPLPDAAGPVLMNIGFGASIGDVKFVVTRGRRSTRSHRRLRRWWVSSRTRTCRRRACVATRRRMS